MLLATFKFLSHLHFQLLIFSFSILNSLFGEPSFQGTQKQVPANDFTTQKKGSTPQNATFPVHIIIKNTEHRY